MGSKSALLSAYNKEGLKEFASTLKDEFGFNLFGSAGTVAYLGKAGIYCKDVAEIVGPPILGHRVVTLSREIHAGLLAKDTPEDRAELVRIGAPFIDLVYVDLYPLEAEIARPGATLESMIEKTDIGGPTLLRSAAKGRRIPICRQADFPLVIDYLREISLGQQRIPEDVFLAGMAAIVEQQISEYCAISALLNKTYAGKFFKDYISLSRSHLFW